MSKGKELGRGIGEKFRSGKINGTFIVMVIYIIVIAIIKQEFFTASNIGNIIRSVSTVGIMGCAVTFIMLTGNTDLSTGYMLSLCACFSCHYVDTNPVLAIVMPILVGTACGFFNGFLVSRIGINSFVTTLGLSYVYSALTQHYTNSQYLTATSDGWYKFIGQGYVFKIIPFPVIIFAVVALVYSFILKRTVFGSKVYAVGCNPVSANFSGISSVKTIWISYTLVGASVGLASIVLCSRSMSAQPLMGSGYEFEVLTAVALGGLNLAGGRGSVLGTVLGVIFVGIIKNSFNLLGLSSGVQYLILGVVLLASVRAALNSEGGM